MPPFDIAVASHVSVAILLHLQTFPIHFLQNVIKLSWNNKLTIELRTLYSSRTVSVIMMMIMSGSGHRWTNHIYHLPNIVAPRHKPGAWADQSLGPVIKSLSDAGVSWSAETAAVFSITYLQTLVSGRRLQQPAATLQCPAPAAAINEPFYHPAMSWYSDTGHTTLFAP